MLGMFSKLLPLLVLKMVVHILFSVSKFLCVPGKFLSYNVSFSWANKYHCQIKIIQPYNGLLKTWLQFATKNYENMHIILPS